MTSYAPDPWISSKRPPNGGGDPRDLYTPRPPRPVRPNPGYRPGAPVGTGGGHPRQPVRPPYTPSWGNDAYGPPTRYGSGGGMQQATAGGPRGYDDYMQEPQIALEGPGFMPPTQRRSMNYGGYDAYQRPMFAGSRY